jgi:hypothetical protein
MIITCNCGEKKFTLPDNSIPAAGRMVQCGFCGLKWKQFPVGDVEKTQSIARPKKVVSRTQPVQPKIQKPKKIKRTAPKQTREISLYSPEYLAKKHGIKINELKPQKTVKQIKKTNISFGFFNTLILFTILFISISRILYFSQSFIVNIFPLTEFYLDYFFESVRNIFEVWKNLITY